MKIPKLPLFLIMILLTLAISCSRQEINKNKVVILAFVDSRKDISEILRTSKEITDADIGIKFHLIDVFIEPELAKSYAIKSTPKFIVLVNGTFLTRTNNLDGACMVAISVVYQSFEFGWLMKE